jgi:hypothetical protein
MNQMSLKILKYLKRHLRQKNHFFLINLMIQMSQMRQMMLKFRLNLKFHLNQMRLKLLTLHLYL